MVMVKNIMPIISILRLMEIPFIRVFIEAQFNKKVNRIIWSQNFIWGTYLPYNCLKIL